MEKLRSPRLIRRLLLAGTLLLIRSEFDPIRSDPVRSGPVRSNPTRCGPVRSGPIGSGPIQNDSSYQDSNTKVVYCLSWVIRQNVIRQLATSSENLVASTQFLVAVATSESQFQALTYAKFNIQCSLSSNEMKNRRWKNIQCDCMPGME